MSSVNSFPKRIMNIIGEQAVKEHQQIKKFEAQLAEARKRHQFVSELNAYLKKDWPQHILALLNKEPQTTKAMDLDNLALTEALTSLRSMAMEKVAVLQRRFPAFLDDACKAANLPLDRESRDPQYTFAKGFFTLVIDYQKGIARLSDYEGRLHEFPSDVGAVVEYVQSEYKRVFGKTFDGQKFIKKVRNHYMAIIKKEGLADGSELPIRRITTRLGKYEKGFRTDEFIIQLSRLVAGGPAEIDNRRLDLQQTKDSHQGIYLHGLAGRGYIGYITFKEVK
ncbi:MAG: hypothetical protein QMD03_05650 [Syntrophales bacterium]|nr:hypothetical protein [Syntrophales bacterium]